MDKIEKIRQEIERLKKYAEEHSKGEFTWVRDALYVAYLTAIQDYPKVRLL